MTARRAFLTSPLLWVVLFLASVTAPALLAVDGRDFAGTYETRDAVEVDDSVTMTFATRIFNYSGGDIAGATVRLEDPEGPEGTIATFVAVDIASGEWSTLAQCVTVPRREWDAWHEAAVPTLTIEYQDAAANTYRFRIELGLGLALDEEDQP